MGVKVVVPCLQWSQPSLSHSPSSPIAVVSPKKGALNDVVLACRSASLGTTSFNTLSRSRSLDFNTKKKPLHSIARACSANFESFSDEEFSRKIQELAIPFQVSEDEKPYSSSNLGASEPLMDSKWFEIQHEPPDWEVDIEMKANSVDLPLSLRMIKRKKQQWQEEFLEVGESAYCSVKKAFSSMVFIIRELHCYTLQMREVLFYEDLKGILARVQSEIHASFVWLFQQVFSHTPTLMMYVMILLANFTVHSMSNSAAIAAVLPAAVVEVRESVGNKFDASAVKSFSVSSGGGKTASIGGGTGGGGNVKPVASGMDGGDLPRPSVVHDGVSSSTTREEQVSQEADDVALWNSVVEEASRMNGEIRDEALDEETLRCMVSPVTAKVEENYDYEEYFRTGLLYQMSLAQEPNNVLLLANYAQFLYLVARDYDRAEEYFKRATGVEPKDAEALNKYANFLWQARKDLWAAEETFLEAISADPTNSIYAANYAHFLWNTGGEDTCFPLASPDDETLDD